MNQTPLYVLTGATSGMGLALARRLAARADIVVGARDPARAAALEAAIPAGRLTMLPLDLERPDDVRAFAAAVAERIGARRIAGLALNAGLQLVGPRQTTPDGLERTFAANHLGHFDLAHRLLPHLAERAPVVSTASGTHDPDDRIARLFGFRGGLFPSAEGVARGDLGPSASPSRFGADAYATSKLCNLLFTLEMARRVPARAARFLAFDPGLMPGTGLARGRSAVERFAWARALPALRLLVPGVSGAERSAATLAEILEGRLEPAASGLYLDYAARVVTPSALARAEAPAADLYAASARLTGVAPLATPARPPAAPEPHLRLAAAS